MFCYECSYYYDSCDSDGYLMYKCYLMGREVHPYGSCGKFEKKYKTPEELNYHEPPTTSSGGCFVSSACIDYLGKADDCEELTILRSFRDNFMKSTTEGSLLVKEYYDIAPKIVEKINESSDKELYYQNIYEIILQCVSFIKNHNDHDAFLTYQKMVLDLKKEFNL